MNLSAMSSHIKKSENIFEKVKELENIIKEQQKVIELLKDRLSEIADDIDRERNKQYDCYAAYSEYRTCRWSW